MSEVDRRILMFLKNNPGATPREVADALGLPYNTVRRAILRLREAGYVVRSSRGGYLVRVGAPLSSVTTLSSDTHAGGGAELLKVLKELEGIKEELRTLRNRVDRLEQEINLIKKGIKIEKPRPVSEDPLLAALRNRGIIRMSEARKLASKPLTTYINDGQATPIGEYLVSQEMLESFKRRFPIKLSNVSNLSKEERSLLDAMIKEGMVYLHAGREYRLIS